MSSLILRYYVLRRIIIDISNNEEAVRLLGIKVTTYKFTVYSISFSLAAITEVISTAHTGVGSYIIDLSMEFDAIARVIISGANLKGGKGMAIQTLGILILGMIRNIMNLIDIPAYQHKSSKV